MLKWIDPTIVPQIPAFQWRSKSCAISDLAVLKRAAATLVHYARIYLGVVTEKSLFDGPKLVETLENAINEIVTAIEKMIQARGDLK